MGSLINSDELDLRISVVQREIGDLQEQLSGKKAVLSALYQIKQNAEILDEVETLTLVEMKTPSNFVGAGMRAEPQLFKLRTPSTKKIRSTSMVGDMVARSGHQWSREEIHQGFLERFGLPDSWQNPANALNNAIARAVENGLISERDGFYMPNALASSEAG